MKKHSAIFLQYLLDRRWTLMTYLGVIGLFCTTFFLYDVPWVVYGDALLFAFFLVAVVTGIQYYYYQRKYWQLEKSKQAVQLAVQERRAVGNLIEKEYEELLGLLDKQWRQEIEELRQTNSRLLDYYSMWSHQIKTPLAVLNLKMQEDQLDRRVFKQELFKIDQYLDMMLQYLRLNHSATDFVFEEVAIDQLVKDTVKKYATFFIYQGLSFSLEETHQVVISDKKWLGFVLEQVLSNALKYTKKGGIRIYGNPVNPKELIIEDTGMGILEEDLSRVFEKGYTGYNGHNHQKASGLGLYMSQQVIRQLGHQIHLTSEVGVGTKVWLNISQHQYVLE